MTKSLFDIKRKIVILDFIVAGFVGVGLLIYLAYTLFYPEKF